MSESKCEAEQYQGWNEGLEFQLAFCIQQAELNHILIQSFLLMQLNQGGNVHSFSLKNFTFVLF